MLFRTERHGMGFRDDTSRRYKRMATAAATLAALLMMGSPWGVSAQPYDWPPDDFEDDPLGLIANYNTTSYYTNIADSIEVWICQPEGHPGVANLTVDQLTDRLNESILPEFFRSLSGGRYDLQFVPGGMTAAFDWKWCEPAEQFETNTAGLMAVADLFNGYGGQSLPPWRFNTYPSNRRTIIAGFYDGLEVMNVSGIRRVLSSTLAWGKSSTRVILEESVYFDGGNIEVYQKDNPMDMLSRGGPGGGFVGTIAVNRYAAGWVDPEQVHVYEGGSDRVTLSVDWEQGTQMVVLPSGERGHFLSLGARAARYHDRDIPKEGIESYIVNHSECDLIQLVVSPDPCWGTDRTHKPWPHDTETKTDALGYTVLQDPLMHVLGVGQSLEWNGITVTVAGRVGDKWTVTVTDGTEPLPAAPGVEVFEDGFVDDDGTTHEQAINQIAHSGITVGCAAEPQPLFCPNQAVTRAEMAAFMLRATGQGNPTPNRSNTFSDVPEGQWYTEYVHAFAETDIDPGTDGLWRPNDPLTRLEMAYWLTGVFDHITPLRTALNPLGEVVSDALGLFEDVNQADWAVAEGLYRVGVTFGCSADPLLYCPDQPVTRGQMASFITRALRD